jgi:sec-independent protein translocase protein TatC
VRFPRKLGYGDGLELVDHLDELRGRLLVAVAAVVVAFGVAFAFHARLLDWLNQSLPPERRHPVTFGVAEPFLTSLKISLVAAVGLALPVILWQVWSFLAPAFDERAQRAIAGFVGFATALFIVGVAFGKAIALPAALKFLTTYDDSQYRILIRAQDYYSFAVMVLVAVGIVFELPVFILALVRLRVLSASKLRGNRRIGIVAMAALAVALPGVDPVTTLLEMVPLMALYEGSIWLAVLFERRWATASPTPRASTVSG